mmetsp:Transcript_125752/g.367481  ORF Transcript_125752/g.367481 Transcript_125752/m.367481 type:complete len:255 (+) Transcript_125752:1907-2671(+)
MSRRDQDPQVTSATCSQITVENACPLTEYQCGGPRSSRGRAHVDVLRNRNDLVREGRRRAGLERTPGSCDLTQATLHLTHQRANEVACISFSSWEARWGGITHGRSALHEAQWQGCLCWSRVILGACTSLYIRLPLTFTSLVFSLLFQTLPRLSLWVRLTRILVRLYRILTFHTILRSTHECCHWCIVRVSFSCIILLLARHCQAALMQSGCLEVFVLTVHWHGDGGSGGVSVHPHMTCQAGQGGHSQQLVLTV